MFCKGISAIMIEKTKGRMAFMKYRILKYDPSLAPYEKDIQLRMDNLKKKTEQLLPDGRNLAILPPAICISAFIRQMAAGTTGNGHLPQTGSF